MKRLYIFLLLWMVGCGYSFVTMSDRGLWLDGVRSRSSAFPGIEADITSALIRELGARGVRFVKRCPYVKVFFLGISSRDYFYDSLGKISGIDGVAKYEVTVEGCDRKIYRKNFTIPIDYRYFTSPFATTTSQRRAIIGSIDPLTDRILEFLDEIDGSS